MGSGMKYILLVVALGGFVKGLCVSGQWTMLYEHQATGAVIGGSLAALKTAVQNGARIRIVMPSGYAAEADYIFVKDGGSVCGQFLWHVSKASWNSFQGNVYWWWNIFCTSGKYYTTRYNIGSHVHRGDSTTTTRLKWFARMDWATVKYSHDSSGNGDQTGHEALAQHIRDGAEVRVVSRSSSGDFGYAPLQNMLVKPRGESGGGSQTCSKVMGQCLTHVSQAVTGNDVKFQSNAYWWFTLLSTSGSRDMSRWNVGEHVDRGHTSDNIAMDWMVDPSWRKAYTNGPKGEAIFGKKSDLISAVQGGHRVRMVILYPDATWYATNVNNVHVRNDHVTAQSIQHVSMNGNTERYQDNAYWVFMMASTTGTVTRARYNVGDTTARGSDVQHWTIHWFVDTQNWKKVLSHGTDGTVIAGSRTALTSAIKEGASVRCVMADGHYAFPAENVAINGDHVAAQTIHSISVAVSGSSEYVLQSNPYWWFTIVTTQGDRKMSRWTVGSHQSRGDSADKVAMNWFVDE
ncbi:uncharacterized protein LOC106163393 [Lingula anatina]|uniref:Uncharacterized protein LOC106163393 n=1 Tax=Lingula anatina TaxID=7574 RepID=A0A1S3IE28_LINAN|nr:uncharacterized protein LOC106163393 [Lingula anatina]|eukprot:XP_013396413.1 uncharacterized protein LOC106163393 [Lingula anatina]